MPKDANHTLDVALKDRCQCKLDLIDRLYLEDPSLRRHWIGWRMRMLNTLNVCSELALVSADVCLVLPTV